MSILADENMLERAVASLRAAGHEVRWAPETQRSAADPNLLDLATQEGRTLIIFDSDFGELAHRYDMPAPYGVLFIRLHEGVPRPLQADLIAGAVPSPSPHGIPGHPAPGPSRFATRPLHRFSARRAGL